jgi:hypothetical protein
LGRTGLEQRLTEHVDLIVMRCRGEARDLLDKIRQPRRTLGQKDLTGLDHRGDCGCPRDLVRIDLDLSHRQPAIAEFLDNGRSAAFVFDQHAVRFPFAIVIHLASGGYCTTEIS